MTIGRRHALLIATDVYTDPTLVQLQTPQTDADALAAVLGDPSVGDYEVRVLRNTLAHEVHLQLEDFFADRGLDDTLLIYFAGHGVKDDTGRLHLATVDSRANRLASTAIGAVFVREQIDLSRARHKLLLLDCCYSGAFPGGFVPRADRNVGAQEHLAGRGAVVITASSAMEYALEPSTRKVSLLDPPARSVFTAALVDGLRTGDADLDRDGTVRVGELYEYVYARVRAASPQQTPTMTGSVQGDFVVARGARGPAFPEPVPAASGSRPAASRNAGRGGSLLRQLMTVRAGVVAAAVMVSVAIALVAWSVLDMGAAPSCQPALGGSRTARIALSSDHGPAGAPVTVCGAGWPPRAQVVVEVEDVLGDGPPPIVEVRTDEGGSFTTTVTIPRSFSGQANFTATTSGSFDVAHFAVAPA
jgi:hypothetical protein